MGVRRAGSPWTGGQFFRVTRLCSRLVGRLRSFDCDLVVISGSQYLYNTQITSWLVSSLVRFLSTRCVESQTHSFAALTRSFEILHNS